MTVQIAVRADIDRKVVRVEAAAKAAEDLFAAAACHGNVDYFGALPLAPTAGHLVQFAERAIRDRVE